MNDPATISEDAVLFLRLHLADNIGPRITEKLLAHFGSVGEIFAASQQALQRVDNLGPQKANAIQRSSREDVHKQVARAKQLGLRILCRSDADYPAPLRCITDPPTCIFIRGQVLATDTVAVAVVGTRRCSRYGREQALRFGRSLASAGFTVVSGLARGVDGQAHRGALDVGGRTLAVLGGGLDRIYPPEHEQLAHDIADQSGALISEYPLDVPPVAGNFPRRNRLIAGLSLGVLVVEAGTRSGACITARLAHDYNREVFAIPGRIDQPDQSGGSNRLIRDCQAKLVMSLDDILDEFNEIGTIMRKESSSDPTTPRTSNVKDTSRADVTHLSRNEQTMLRVIEQGEIDADHLARKVKLPMPVVNAGLTSLQLKGMIRELPGHRYVLRRD
ncbi:MAG: DNA-processing protein DprA [Planctomycetota bacterium]|jgi:DNA processing protein